MKIRVSPYYGHGSCAISLETEPPPEGDAYSTFFSAHVSALGAEVNMFLRAEDLRILYYTLNDYLFNEQRAIQQ